jgi:two-component system, OmpR family, phosphate regulon sensor histidine kinase PhoR
MNRRIRIIIIGITLCILGINFFQGYWLYYAYRQQREHLQKDVNEALLQALENQQAVDVRNRLFAGDPGPDSLFIFQFEQHIKMDSLKLTPPPPFELLKEKETQRIVINRTDSNKQLRVMLHSDFDPALRSAADTLAQKISTMIIADRFLEGSADLARLDSFYRVALSLKGIAAPYQLDTLRAPGPEVLAESAERRAASLRTALLPLNPLSRLYVQAAFNDTRSYLLRRMAGLLAASLALLLFTTWCFVYMLQTILTQKKLAQIKNDFINNMAHELRTPVATVSAAIESIQRFDALADRQRTNDYLHIANGELQRLSRLVDQVLDVAVERHNGLALQLQPTDLPALIGQIMDTHRLRSDKAVQLSLDCKLQQPALAIDALHFGNAVSNLIDNAIKYSGQEVQVEIACREAFSGIEIQVRDNGWGIEPAYQRHVFERFFRVPQGDRHDVKGFGLGLAYVEKVIEQHRGRIRLESEPGRGTVFTIFLPTT